MHKLFISSRLRFLIVAVAIALGAAPVSAAAPAESIRIGAIPTDGGSVVFYAKELGYFERNGIDATIETMPSGVAIAAAVIGNSLDIGVTNAATAAQARLRGIHMMFVAPGEINDPPPTMTTAIMAAPGSAIKTGADAEGKTIAVSALKNLTQLAAAAWIDRHGGDSKTLKYVEVPPAQMGAALKAHRVDLAVMVEPFVTAARDAGDAVMIGDGDDGIGPRYMVLGWFGMEPWLAAHHDLAVRFQLALSQASEWANTHPHESAAILARNSGISEQLAGKMHRARLGTSLSPEWVQPVLDAALKYGYIDRPVDAAELVWTP